MHLRAFLSRLILTVMSHDLRHVTQAGARPIGIPSQCLCLGMASHGVWPLNLSAVPVLLNV